MRIADFLYRKLGLNIFKAAPHLRTQTPEVPAPAEDEPEHLEQPTPINTSSTDVIHIGPRGGRYKVDAKGRKVYLKASWSRRCPHNIASQTEQKYRSIHFAIKQSDSIQTARQDWLNPEDPNTTTIGTMKQTITIKFTERQLKRTAKAILRDKLLRRGELCTEPLPITELRSTSKPATSMTWYHEHIKSRKTRLSLNQFTQAIDRTVDPRQKPKRFSSNSPKRWRTVSHGIHNQNEHDQYTHSSHDFTGRSY